MLLWTILTIIAVVVAATATIPLVRRYDARQSPRDATLGVLRDQLGEVDAQVAGGAIDAREAEALRTEIKRRMLGTAREVDAVPRPLGGGALGGFAIGLAAAVGIAATLLYSTLGRPELASVAPVPEVAAASADTAANPAAATEVAAMVAKLEARMKDHPQDAEGWRMLGWSYFQTQRFAESADAYGRAVKLAPSAPGNASAYGEALVQAAGGIVKPDARLQFAAAVALDKTDARARYFLGLAKEQAGDPKAAVADWLALLRESPPGAPWAGELRRVIADTAGRAGVDVAAQLAASGAVAVAGSAPPSPSAEQVKAVQAMAPTDQQAMIRGMVDRLAARLKANPKDAGGWVRLMRARMVLGDPAAAAAARRDALAALAGDAAGTAAIAAAAGELGIKG